jgi:hypothetical protein
VISRERLRLILREAGVSFQRTRTWKESKDPDKDLKLDRIEEVTSPFPHRCFAFDQFGPLIRPCHGVRLGAADEADVATRDLHPHTRHPLRPRLLHHRR